MYVTPPLIKLMKIREFLFSQQLQLVKFFQKLGEKKVGGM